MTVSAITSLTNINPIGNAAPITPTTPVSRVVRRRKAVNAEGEVVNPMLVASSPASMSTPAVLNALIALHPE